MYYNDVLFLLNLYCIFFCQKFFEISLPLSLEDQKTNRDFMGNFFSQEKETHFSVLNENIEDNKNACDVLEEKTKSNLKIH